MKQFVIALIMINSFSFLAQTEDIVWRQPTPYVPSKNVDETKPISFVTYQQDTLYLIDEGLGKLTAKLWEGKNYKPERDGKKPKIVFVTQNYILTRYSNHKSIVND